jgi:sialidase-1
MTARLFWGWLALNLLASATAVGQTAEQWKHLDVFRAGEEGYFAFRIPAIEVAADGSLVVFAEARKYNLNDPGFGNQDIDLVCKRSTDRGASWSSMKVIEDPGEYWSAANPVLLLDRANGRLWVFYIRCRPGCNTNTARAGTDDILVLARCSDNHGQDWSEPIDLTPVVRDMSDATWRVTVPGPGGAICSRTGRLVVPAWKVDGWQNFAFFSDDHGKSWQRSEFVPGNRAGNENQLVELSDGRLLMDIRQTSGAHRWRSISADGGRKWSVPEPGHIVSPVCCAIERYPREASGLDRDLILWTGPQGPGRQILMLQLSEDDGRTFARQWILAPEPAAYSDLAVLPDGSVAVFWERGNYKFLTLTLVNRELFRGRGN